MEEVKAYFTNWIEEAVSSSPEAFKSLAQSFTQKMRYIVNWFKKKISSAISEGFNIRSKGLNGWLMVIRTSSISG
jgi:transposase